MSGVGASFFTWGLVEEVCGGCALAGRALGVLVFLSPLIGLVDVLVELGAV